MAVTACESWQSGGQSPVLRREPVEPQKVSWTLPNGPFLLINHWLAQKSLTLKGQPSSIRLESWFQWWWHLSPTPWHGLRWEAYTLMWEGWKMYRLMNRCKGRVCFLRQVALELGPCGYLPSSGVTGRQVLPCRAVGGSGTEARPSLQWSPWWSGLRMGTQECTHTIGHCHEVNCSETWALGQVGGQLSLDCRRSSCVWTQLTVVNILHEMRADSTHLQPWGHSQPPTHLPKDSCECQLWASLLDGQGPFYLSHTGTMWRNLFMVSCH